MNEGLMPEIKKKPQPMLSPTASNTISDDAFGAILHHGLLRLHDGRLRDLNWFRTDWQRGGALTGYAVYDNDAGEACDVVVKIPVPPQERDWLIRTQPEAHEFGDIAPKLYAYGDSVGTFDFAWLIMEKLKHGPMDHHWNGAEFDMLVETICKFYAVSKAHPVKAEAKEQDWEGLIERSRKKVKEQYPQHAQTWNQLMKRARKKMKKILRVWGERDLNHWRHGDVHLGNAMTREPAPAGPALIFDFALARTGHWVEDAVYFEHLYWADPDRLGGRELVKMFAAGRKQYGLKVGAKYPLYADIRRVMLAATAPVSVMGAGNIRFIQAAMERLEALLPKMKF